MSIFISYSHKDKAIAHPIAEALVEIYGKEAVYFDEMSTNTGDNLLNFMADGIDKCEAFIPFFSKNYFGKDSNSLKEFHAAWSRDNVINIIPIRIDNCDIPSFYKALKYHDYDASDSVATLVSIIKKLKNVNGFQTVNISPKESEAVLSNAQSLVGKEFKPIESVVQDILLTPDKNIKIKRYHGKSDLESAVLYLYQLICDGEINARGQLMNDAYKNINPIKKDISYFVTKDRKSLALITKLQIPEHYIENKILVNGVEWTVTTTRLSANGHGIVDGTDYMNIEICAL